MKCLDFRNKILFYIDEHLNVNDKISFENHLKECSSCKKLYENIHKAYSNFGIENNIQTNKQFYEEVMFGLQAKSTKSKIRYLTQNIVLQMAGAVIIGAFAVLLGHLIADNLQIKNEIVQDEIILSDIEQFAYENHFTISTDDLYYLNFNETD